VQDMIFLIPCLPLGGALLCALIYAWGGSGLQDLAGKIAAAAVGTAFAITLADFIGGESLHQELFTWIAVDKLEIPLEFTLDPLSGFMALIVTGVGFLIHVYSLGYMADDDARAKYFAYLNLFIAAMSVLILGSSLPVMFIGWEGVGLMSYLLIGFWYDKDDGRPAKAGQKAFIANRVGDLAFLLGMFLLFTELDTVSFAGMQTSADKLDPEIATWACLLLFVGATGKSAQLPLYVWLPDATAGPTPVSALIHAATMVTAGIYMLCRTSFLFALSPTAMLVVAVVGAVTALFAATIALAQRDIKKILAYSTVSQLGYMFLACGVGAYSAAIFHVATHAFFKALLFLGAGSIIHGMHGEQDVMRMGGLRKFMPVTWITFLIGSLCLAGFPLTSGFFSTDEILWETARAGTQPALLLWGVGAITALLTAFYSFRLVSLTFLGEPRFVPAEVHPHESPKSMTVPLVILAGLALVGGALGLPQHLLEPLGHIPNWIHHYLEPVITSAHPLVPTDGDGHTMSTSAEGLFMFYSSIIAVVGILGGYMLFQRGPDRAGVLVAKMRPLHTLVAGKWFVDEIYELFVLAPLAILARAAAWFDLHIVDGLVNGVGSMSRCCAHKTARLHDGHLQTYALWMAAGTAIILGIVVVQLL